MTLTDSEKLDKVLSDLDSIKNHLKIVPDQFITITDIEEKIENYQEFAVHELGLSLTTIKNQKSAIHRFLNYSQGAINKETVTEYLKSNESSSWKSNQIKALRKFIRDYLQLGNWINEFVFSREKAKIKNAIPTDNELALFCSKLDYESQMIFLILVTSGLRIGEVLSLHIDDVNFDTNMIDASKVHKSNTKSSWISFMTNQVSEYVQNYVESLYTNKLFPVSYKTVQENFRSVSEEIGIKIKPHLLRTVFTEKCTQAGLEEKYIDAFCGRISQNVIRKHYTDYSPEAMRRHYDKVEPFLGLPFAEN
jgi:integrase/recombinase XerD